MKSPVDLEYAGLTAPFDAAFGPGMAGPAASSDDDPDDDDPDDDNLDDDDWDDDDLDDDDWDDDEDDDEDWDEDDDDWDDDEDDEEEDLENETENDVLFESRFLNHITDDEAARQKLRVVRDAQPKKDKVTSHRPRKQRVRSPFQSHDSADDDDD
jgi:hypothetical protein